MSDTRNGLGRAEARFRQIACLGLPQQWVVPELLRALHEVVNTHWNVFFWCDPEGRITNLYNESPIAMSMAPVYVNEFVNQRELEVFQGWEEVIRTCHQATDFDAFLRVSRRTFLRHDLYHQALGPMEFYWGLQTVIRDGDIPLGILGMTRLRDERPFSAQEARRLDRLSPFISHALVQSESRRPHEHWVDSDDEGLIICDGKGRIQFLSPQARLLLPLTCHERFAFRLPELTILERLNPPLMGLVRNLAAIREGRSAVKPPSVLRENAWGRFRFSANWLDSTKDDGKWIGITVRRQEPLGIRLVRQAEKLGLPRRQAQVCVLMAQGQSYTRISELLGISESTVISHGRAVYNRVDAHNRTELLSHLLTLP